MVLNIENLVSWEWYLEEDSKFTFEGWLDNHSNGKTDPVKSSDDRYEREEGESW